MVLNALKSAREYIDWLEAHKDQVPNANRLIVILQNDSKQGHLFHAESIKKFVESGVFTVTDIELKGLGSNVDIQLNNTINLQI